ESALAQTHASLEVLVCDDGSSDDTEQRVRAMSDPRVRWLPGPRGGRPAIPRNRGIAAARGEWLRLPDTAAQWPPGKPGRQRARRCAPRDGSRAAPMRGGFRPASIDAS